MYQDHPTLDDIGAFLQEVGCTFVRSVGNDKDDYTSKVGRIADVLRGNNDGRGG
jgi:hypothetical protein